MQEYTKTDQQLHHLSQVIAKANRTFVPPKNDDSHTNLFFDSLANRLTGRWIHTEKRDILLSLNLENQAFEFIDHSLNILESVSSISKKRREVETEIESLLPKLGLNPKGFISDLHFEISNYDFADKPILALDAKNIETWKKYRSLANEACYLLLGHAHAHEEVRIWPHHFDTGIYFKAHKNMGVGFGLAMEDTMVGAPYFYLSAYPEGIEIEYKNMPAGKWNWELTDHWKGSVLSLNALDETSTCKKSDLDDYIKSVYKWIISQ